MDTPRRTARLAGLAYLGMGVATIFGYVCAPLVTSDPAALARLLTVSEQRFRLGIASDLLSCVLGVVLVVLLYRLLSPVGEVQAALMALLLLVSVPISFVVTLDDVAARMLLTGADFLSALAQPQREALGMLLVRLHMQAIYAVEVFWGLWLVPFGLLVIKSRFLPRILGVFLLVGGFAYVAHSFVSLLLPGARTPAYETATMVGRGIGELPIILWLVIRGTAAGRTAGDPP